MDTEHRWIEEWLPLEQINREAQREKSMRVGHISTLHQWWSRKPLVASRVAIYATLLRIATSTELRETQRQLALKLAQCVVSPEVLAQAREEIITSYKDLPRVLDPFAGGGSIPLEALRLGCNVYANDLNPVAYILQCCTLVYPQKWGDSLADEVEQWGEWVYSQVQKEIADLYPLLHKNGELFTPSAYLWTRTVKCSNPLCKATVPLLRKSWLRRKIRKYIALILRPDRTSGEIQFELMESQKDNEREAIAEWGFDPSAFAHKGHVRCLHCGATLTPSYLRREGLAGRMEMRLMAVACTSDQRKGKIYVVGEEAERLLPDPSHIEHGLSYMCEQDREAIPDQMLPPAGTLGISVQNYGFRFWRDLFTPRQLLVMVTFCKWVRQAYQVYIDSQKHPAPDIEQRACAVISYLALGVTKLANRGSSLVIYNPFGEKLESPISNGRLSLNWDIAEANPLGNASGNFRENLRYTTRALRALAFESNGHVQLSNSPAQCLDLATSSIDAVITDPPYYDNIPYSSLADYFYIWLQQMLKPLYPQQMLLALSPKKQELVADRAHCQGNMRKTKARFQQQMSEALSEIHRVLKPEGLLVLIYAHKTTAGWSSMIDALRQARFEVTEAWPLTTERKARLRAQGSAALASSIFLVARKRLDDTSADLQRDILPKLQAQIADRINTLFAHGLQGTDLMIACIGSGLRLFTQYAEIELPSGESMSTTAFLEEVQREVAVQILAQIMGFGQAMATGMDAQSQFYAILRFQFGYNKIPFDEANILARGLGIELATLYTQRKNGRALLHKSGAAIDLLDFSHRGQHCAQQASSLESVLDHLHALLWISQHNPEQISTVIKLYQASELLKMRLLAQALSGRLTSESKTTITHSRSIEQKQIDILLAVWDVSREVSRNAPTRS